MSKMIIGERIGITKIEYMRIVCSRLKEGGEIQGPDRRQRGSGDTREKTKSKNHKKDEGRKILSELCAICRQKRACNMSKLSRYL